MNKQDLAEYKKLQSNYEVLEKNCADNLDNLENALKETLKKQEDKEEVDKLFNNLTDKIEEALYILIDKSKTILNKTV